MFYTACCKNVLLAISGFIVLLVITAIMPFKGFIKYKIFEIIIGMFNLNMFLIFNCYKKSIKNNFKLIIFLKE